jgi:molybdenum cofactor cytidylyltransferase
MTIAAIVLAAGAASRFGSPKALATFEGRPLLEHVLDAIRTAGIEEVVVVLGHSADLIEERIDWLSERRVRNPDPSTLSSSLQVGLAAIADMEPPVRGILIALGDQPRTRPEVIRALIAASREAERPVVVPSYAEGGGPNPVLVRREAFGLIDEASGDRGLGPILGANEDLVVEVHVPGSNPDVDTPSDLAELVWAERVRANREQVERLREVADGTDFYAPVSSLFRADPARDDDPVLAALLEIAEPEETWLDIGAGAGRYALPLARVVREVVAVDPSAAMLDGLRAGMAEHSIGNLRPIEARWPMAAEAPSADVALIAHVGYDVEAIGPFVEAMERAARRLCVAVMMQRAPASQADSFWPPVHGEARVPLPALPEFVDLLRAGGRDVSVRTVPAETRRFASREDVARAVRRQLWIADEGEKQVRFERALDEIVEGDDEGRYALAGVEPVALGIVTWEPRR